MTTGKQKKSELPTMTSIQYMFVIVAGLALPLLLIPIVQFTGYSELFEEVAKALVVLACILKLPSNKDRIKGGLTFGFLFGLSESIFYLNNMFQAGNVYLFWQRIALTVPMHMVTMLVMVYFGSLGKKYLVIGVIAASLLHLAFNRAILEFFVR